MNRPHPAIPGHLPALDGLRGLAILMVIAHNVELLEAPEMNPLVKAVYFGMNFGWVGVILFFVLSGFLITGILLDTLGRPRALPNFIARRALRIFPLYYGALLLIFVLLPALGLQPELYREQVPYQGWLWAYLSNWTDAMNIGPKALPHFWSLAVEEQFYLMWPLLVYFVLRSPVNVAKASLVIAALSLASRAWMMDAGFDIDMIYKWTNGRLDALTLGAFAAACWRIPAWSTWIKAHARQIAAAVAALLLGAAVFTHGLPRTGARSMVWGYGALAICFAALIYAAAYRDSVAASPTAASSPKAIATLWHTVLTWPVLQQVGKYSYGMYVIHKPLHDLYSAKVVAALNIPMKGHLLNASLHVLAVTLISFAAAWLSYNLFEARFLRMKRYFA